MTAPAPALHWPADETMRLATIESFVLIGRPAAAVFEFVTNASLWSHWHPATVSVLAAARPLTAGERMTETIRAGRRRLTATWTVLACEPPSLWVIAASPPQGDARIVYELRERRRAHAVLPHGELSLAPLAVDMVRPQRDALGPDPAVGTRARQPQTRTRRPRPRLRRLEYVK